MEGRKDDEYISPKDCPKTILISNFSISDSIGIQVSACTVQAKA
jgi:hypothetical protein